MPDDDDDCGDECDSICMTSISVARMSASLAFPPYFAATSALTALVLTAFSFLIAARSEARTSSTRSDSGSGEEVEDEGEDVGEKVGFDNGRVLDELTSG